MSYRWQRNLDGWALSKEEKISFIRKVVKVGNFYKGCKKMVLNQKTRKFEQCANNVVNKPNRHFCAEHSLELLSQFAIFNDPVAWRLVWELQHDQQIQTLLKSIE